MYSEFDYKKFYDEAKRCEDYIIGYTKGQKKIKIDLLLELKEKLILSSKNVSIIDNMIEQLKG